MNSANQVIIQSFFYICKQTRSGYVRISQQRMLEILKTYYETDICRRTLNYHLRALEDDNFIKRIKRHRRGEDGRILFHTSINILKKKAVQVIAKLANYLKNVRWIFHRAPEQNSILNVDQFKREMIENYRLSFNSS